MCLSLVLVVASVSALNLALPDLAVDMGASTNDLTWIADSYTVALAALISWRVVMGVGAAMIMPGTLSTITAAFPEEQRSRGVAIWPGWAAAGAILGLLAAGALLEAFDWSSIFLMSAAVALVAAVAAVAFSPETRDEEPPRPDVAGAVLTALAIGSFVFAVIEGNERGWTEPLVLGTLAVAALCLALYAFAGMRTHEPLLDPRLFGIRGFAPEP
jgi:MFS family permease